METGFKPCGFIELATSPDRLSEYRRISTFNRAMGVDVQEISPAEIKRMVPLVDVTDVLSGFYVPTDGRVNPCDAAYALCKGSKMLGVKVFENSRVSSVATGKTTSGLIEEVKGVRLEDGSEIKADVVVNCAGMWARQLGEKNGVVIPNQVSEIPTFHKLLLSFLFFFL